MKIFSSEPLQNIKHKLNHPDSDYDQEEAQYEEAWLLGDDPEGDVNSLIRQKRIEKRE